MAPADQAQITYADALVDEIDPRDRRVHTTYALAVATTGRFSSNDPNLQNIPIRTEEGRKIRRAFVAEPGHVLLSADYSQIELRLAAHVADIAALKEAFLAGRDIHALTASEVFGVPLAAMDAITRRRAKAINFGIIYGISAFGLGNQIGVPQAEAADYIHAYFERFPASATIWSGSRPIAAARLCRDDVRPQLLHPRHPRRQPGAPRRRRAPGDQRAAARRRRRHHQARDEPHPGRARGGAYARGCCSRSMTSWCSRRPRPKSSRPPPRQDGDGRRLRPALRALGAARRRNRLGAKLGRGALAKIRGKRDAHSVHTQRKRA